jgi:hypothetical protein
MLGSGICWWVKVKILVEPVLAYLLVQNRKGFLGR